MDYSITPKIPTDYDPKADSAETIKTWNKKTTQSVSRYLVSYQSVVPLITLGVTGLMVTIWLFAKPHVYHATVKKLIYHKNFQGWEMRTHMYILMTMSVVFSIYVVSMDGLAITSRNRLPNEMKKWFHHISNLSNIAIWIIVLDAIVLGASLLAGVVLYSYNAYKAYKEPKDYETTPTEEQATTSNENASTTEELSDNCFDTAVPWYFIVFPAVNVAIHVDQIIIGFIHNPYHATAIGISYSVIFVLGFTLLKYISHFFFIFKAKWSSRTQYCVLVPIFGVTLILIVGLFTYFVAIYTILPINNAIDEGPNRIAAFYQSVFLVTAAAITYWLVVKKHKPSIVDLLVNAKKKEHNPLFEEEEVKIGKQLNLIMKKYAPK